MTYDEIATFSKSWGLVYLTVMFLVVCAYALWPRNQQKFDRAAQMPLVFTPLSPAALFDLLCMQGPQSDRIVSGFSTLAGLPTPVEGNSDSDVLVVEDIIDTGFTLTHVLHLLKAREPKRLRTCALLDKPSRREVPVKADWTGFDIPDEFVVGYGIDFAQRNRNLPFIGKVRFTDAP